VIQPADRHPRVEAGVEVDRLLALYTYRHLDAGALEDRLAVSANPGVLVELCDHDAAHAAFDDHGRARRTVLAVTGVGTRLERAVERGSARRLTGPAQRDFFGVLETGSVVIARGDDFAVSNDDRAHAGVGRWRTCRLIRKGERMSHEQDV
jgi:hypothetical protein